MWSWRRRDDDIDDTRRDAVVEERERDDVVDERAGASPGLVRALFTLAGVAGAGALIWLAQTFDLDSESGFWAAMAVLAAAGVALGLSQLLGGWTKWGLPTISPMVFLVGFLPTLVVGGWIVLARQPDGGWAQGRFDGWTSDLGLASFADDLATFLPIIPVIVGLVFAFTFDTTGPRTRIVRERDEEVVTRPATVVSDGDEDYDEEVVATPTVAEELRDDPDTYDDDERTVAEELREDREAETVVVGRDDDTTVERRDV